MRILQNAENVTIQNNVIEDVRSGILVDGRGNTGSSITNNTIENTKGAVLVQYSAGEDITIAGNTQGTFGNEWGTVLNLNLGTPTNAHATASRQAHILGVSQDNGGWTVMDREYQLSNRSHVVVDDSSTATAADDFSYGNGLGNARQPLKTIQSGIYAVVNGGFVNVADGTYNLGSTLSIDKSLTMTGAGQGATIINAAASGYGISVSADDVTLSSFTLNGPSADAGSSYGIKVSPNGGGSSAVLNDFTITNVTVNGSGRAELDLNGVNTAMIDGFTANGMNTKGAGIQIADSQNVTVRNSTTTGNLWGGLALYLTNDQYDQQLGNIFVEANNDFQEANGIYLESRSPLHDSPFGTFSIAGYDFIVENPDHRAGGENFTFFQQTMQNAFDFAVNLANAASSAVGGWTGTDYDGNMYVGFGNLSGGGTQALSIQTAIDAADAGNTVNILNGVYSPGARLNVNKSLTITGESQSGTVINAGGTGYGMLVTANDVSLSDFTFQNAAHYGIKVQPASTADPANELNDFSIANVTIRDSARTGLDLNGVVGAVIDNVTVENSVSGNGITLTDSADILITGSTTSNNAWGGLALYQANKAGQFGHQVTDIVIDGTNTFNEINAVYAQQYTSAAHEFGDVSIEGFSHVITNPDTDGGNTIYSWFQKTLENAIEFAVNTVNPGSATIEGWDVTDTDGNFYVGSHGGTAMSIQTAVNAADDNDTINVLGGTYASFGTFSGNATGLTIQTVDDAVIDGATRPATNRIVDLRADGTTFTGFTITSDGGGVGIAIPGQNVTVSNNTISNVLTGIQTNTGSGNADIAGNIITADYGISLQSAGNTVSGNTVNAALEGMGVLAFANTVNGNTFTLDAGAAGLALYGGATASQIAAADNTVNISGGTALQGAADLAGENGTLNVGAGTYAGGAQLNNAGLTMNGADGALITVANGQNGLEVRADDITISGLEIAGPIVGDWRTVDWDDPSVNYSIGINISQNRSGIVITNNNIHDIRSGINVANNSDASITNNRIENTKGGVLVRPASITALSGNTEGPLGNEWGIVLNLQNIDDTTTADAARQAFLLGLSNDNDGMYVFDRGYGFKNRTHIFVDDDTPIATAADDFGYGNGLGNERQELPSIQAAFNSVVNGGFVQVASGTYAGTAATNDQVHLTATGTANIGGLTLNGAGSTIVGTYAADGDGFSFGTPIVLTGNLSLTTTGAAAITTGAIDGSSAGGQTLTINAGGPVSLGNLGAATRLGAASIGGAGAKTLTGGTYNANSLAFAGPVTLTQGLTTFNTTQSGTAAGNITFTGDIFGTANGAQSVNFIAGNGAGARSSNGDVSIQNAGTQSVQLGSMIVNADDFSAATVWLAGNYSGQMTGNQTFSSQTLNAGGNVNSTVGGNASGPVNSGGNVNMGAGGNVSGNISGNNVTVSGTNVNSNITATNNANITAQNSYSGSVTANNGTINANTVNANVNGGSFTVNSNGGSVTGNPANLTTSGGALNVNGQTVIGGVDGGFNQIIVEGFVLPQGAFITDTGDIILPEGMAIGLISPAAGEGATGEPRVVFVRSVQRLGALLAEGFTAIVIDLNTGFSDEEQELAMARSDIQMLGR